MKLLTGRERHRCLSVSQGGYGRSRSSAVSVLELEEKDDATGELSWRYATFADLSADKDLSDLHSQP